MLTVTPWRTASQARSAATWKPAQGGEAYTCPQTAGTTLYHRIGRIRSRPDGRYDWWVYPAKHPSLPGWDPRPPLQGVAESEAAARLLVEKGWDDATPAAAPAPADRGVLAVGGPRFT